MSKGWAWIAGILVTVCIVALMLSVRSERQAYWAHRALVVRTAQQAQAQQQPPGAWLIVRRIPRPEQ
ncbi:MAG: hypothetical protein MUC34_17480 [Anaerolineae bacterium]|jgi:hypothetical protein|nr:hypothetical protein [Anaerolineae bacterium]